MPRKSPTAKSIRNTILVISDPNLLAQKTDSEIIGDVSALITVALRITRSFSPDEIDDIIMCKALAVFFASVESDCMMDVYLKRAVVIAGSNRVELERIGDSLIFIIKQTSSKRTGQSAKRFFYETLVPMLPKEVSDRLSFDLLGAGGE